MRDLEWMQNVSADAKVAFVLAWVEKVMGPIEKYEWYPMVREALDMCWEWVEEKKHRGDELYEKLEDDEGDHGLFLVYIEEIDCENPIANDPQLKQVFDCILYAVAYVTRKAYIFDGEENHIPQTVSVATDELIAHEFMKEIVMLDGYQESLARRLKQYLIENDLNSSCKKIKRTEILKILLDRPVADSRSMEENIQES